MSSESRHLCAGQPEIQLFGDGSYQQLISVGTWAYCVPNLGLQEAGLEAGPGVEHFEIQALLSGAVKIMAVDHTRRPIRMFTDSECAVLFLRHAMERGPLPVKRVFRQVHHLYDRALEVTAARKLFLTKVTGNNPKHHSCHRLATQRMRDELASDPELAWRCAYRKEEYRLEGISKEQRALELQLDALKEEATLIRARMRALELGRPQPVSAAECEKVA